MSNTLNLGILAHVDAGKTSLTERLLYSAGVIDEIGRVDDGNTQTDTLVLERQRGITIRSAVVSFALDGRTVNLIDTPGHPDFIAEVERALGVLDGAVLVVSAVEGVQAQTRVLMRALRRLRVPTLLFVNKIDRGGADPDRVLAAVTDRLAPGAVALGTVHGAGTRAARYEPYPVGRLVEPLAEHDDALLTAYLEDEPVPESVLRRALAEQTGRGLVHPVVFGSAVTGAGVPDLVAALRDLLPAAGGTADGPVSGSVFKIDRGPAGEKIAYVRMRSGTIRRRDRLRYGSDVQGRTLVERVTAIRVYDGGPAQPRESVSAGQIATLTGLAGARIGDTLGVPGADGDGAHFAPPTLETAVRPRESAQRGALYAALTELAEQDPLIGLRRDDVHHEVVVSLYGEVQKEVLQATLAAEYGLAVTFRETTTIRVERPVGVGSAVEVMGQDGNPFRATVGLRVEPGPVDSGVRFRLGVELGSLPYSFFRAVEESARAALDQGLYGWQVVDCLVTMTHSGFVPPPPYGWSVWSSSAGDFRALTPLVLMSALARAGTQVYEPVHLFRIEAPADTIPAVLPVLSRLRSVPLSTETYDRIGVVTGEIPAGSVHALGQRLPAVTRGEADLESSFDHYQPVTGTVPTRERTDHNPLNRKEYLLHVRHHA
ncbi:elongation factor G [Actinocatenispora rupis]|uniref:Tetracycline resistance protein, tetM/tetO subfamily n=1 Tax=Actinocatenispora rupis TaxID=519421 RepID=A0A8J3JBI8_9ACTN|nr:TetM/TetW/TetO/TetS family tetracycline resistance ribosomal protection protein [Actinocatenispora rupis]GID15400.1 tetracycline resistance protein, tetM/tetO subfamily [Actinocatenispora rupis]